MTLQEFNALDETGQAESIWERGIHDSHREDREHIFILFRIDSFFVEIGYHKAYNSIRSIRGLVTPQYSSNR